MFPTETRCRRSVGSSKRPLAAFLQEFGVAAVLVTVFSRVWCCSSCFIVDAVAVDVVSVVVVIEAAVDSDANVTFIGV